MFLIKNDDENKTEKKEDIKQAFDMSAYTIFLLCTVQECPVGTFKNVSGSDGALCHQCPAYELPRRAIYISVRGICIVSVHFPLSK